MTGELPQLVDGRRPPAYAAVKRWRCSAPPQRRFAAPSAASSRSSRKFDWVTAVAVGTIVGRTATSAGTSWITGTAALPTWIPAHAVVARMRFIPWMRRSLTHRCAC